MLQDLTIDRIEDWNQLFPNLKEELKSGKVLALMGAMGSGKTTFTARFMNFLGTQDDPSSPTYAIVNEYRTGDADFPIVYHMDLYRLRSIEEAIALPVEEYLYSGHLCIIEWPELIDLLLPDTVIKLQILVEENGSRKVVFL